MVGSISIPRRRGASAVAVGALVLLLAAVATADSDAPDGPDFAREGWYVGVGASLGFPLGWSSDWLKTFEGDATAAANAAGLASAKQIIDPNATIVERDVTASGLDLDDLQPGVGGMVGYRLAPNGSLEIEAEWLSGTGSQNFTIDDTGDVANAKVDQMWTITGNVKVFPWTGRIQPFGIFGLGAFHARVETRAQTTGLTRDGSFQGSPPAPVPADFTIQKTKSKWDGAFRLGLGLDVYVTEHIAAEIKADYLRPFVKLDGLTTDYLSVRLGGVYRF